MIPMLIIFSEKWIAQFYIKLSLKIKYVADYIIGIIIYDLYVNNFFTKIALIIIYDIDVYNTFRKMNCAILY